MAGDMDGEAKWVGKATVKLTGARADQVWPLLEDFCNLHQWLPTIDTCRNVEGVPGQPGCVRFCSKTTISAGGDETVSWAKEKLLAVDPIRRSIIYEVGENNVGFGAYVGTMKVLPESDGGDAGCSIEWSFVADPMEGWTQEAILSYIDSSLQGMAKRMEEALLPSK